MMLQEISLAIYIFTVIKTSMPFIYYFWQIERAFEKVLFSVLEEWKFMWKIEET